MRAASLSSRGRPAGVYVRQRLVDFARPSRPRRRHRRPPRRLRCRACRRAALEGNRPACADGAEQVGTEVPIESGCRAPRATTFRSPPSEGRPRGAAGRGEELRELRASSRPWTSRKLPRAVGRLGSPAGPAGISAMPTLRRGPDRHGGSGHPRCRLRAPFRGGRHGSRASVRRS